MRSAECGVWSAEYGVRNTEYCEIRGIQNMNDIMKMLWPVLLRIAFVFVVFLGLQFIIPYYFLVGGGVLAGGFMYKTSDDRPLALALLIGSVLFGVFAYLYGQV